MPILCSLTVRDFEQFFLTIKKSREMATIFFYSCHLPFNKKYLNFLGKSHVNDDMANLPLVIKEKDVKYQVSKLWIFFTTDADL